LPRDSHPHPGRRRQPCARPHRSVGDGARAHASGRDHAPGACVMAGLSIRTVTGDAAGVRAGTDVQVVVPVQPKAPAWHHGVTHIALEVGEHETVTLTGTPGVLRRLLCALDSAICDAEIEADAARAAERDGFDAHDPYDQAVEL